MGACPSFVFPLSRSLTQAAVQRYSHTCWDYGSGQTRQEVPVLKQHMLSGDKWGKKQKSPHLTIVLGTGTWTQMKWEWPRNRMEEARAESHGDKPSRLTSVVGRQWGDRKSVV